MQARPHLGALQLVAPEAEKKHVRAVAGWARGGNSTRETTRQHLVSIPRSTKVPKAICNSTTPPLSGARGVLVTFEAVPFFARAGTTHHRGQLCRDLLHLKKAQRIHISLNPNRTPTAAPVASLVLFDHHLRAILRVHSHQYAALRDSDSGGGGVDDVVHDAPPGTKNSNNEKQKQSVSRRRSSKGDPLLWIQTVKSWRCSRSP